MAGDHAVLADQARQWIDAGHEVAIATVLATWGSSPRPVGSWLLVRDDAEFLGSVSGGCIEGEVIREALDSIDNHAPRRLEFGVSNEQAWEVGLACGGRVEVYVNRVSEPDWLDKLCNALNSRRQIAIAIHLDDGNTEIFSGDAPFNLDLPPGLDQGEVQRRFIEQRSGLLPSDKPWFMQVHAPAPRLLVVGAVHIAQSLVIMAEQTGFEVTLIDPRQAFASEARFPGASISDDWPDEAIEGLLPDSATAIVTLSHDPKLDDPALISALKSPAFYIGSLGSRRTHAARIERLREAGFSDRDFERIHAPIGLHLGGRAPAEIAVSIMAEVLQARYRVAT